MNENSSKEKLQEVVDAQIYADTDKEAVIKHDSPHFRKFDRLLAPEEVKARYQHMRRLMKEENEYEN